MNHHFRVRQQVASHLATGVGGRRQAAGTHDAAEPCPAKYLKDFPVAPVEDGSTLEQRRIIEAALNDGVEGEGSARIRKLSCAISRLGKCNAPARLEIITIAVKIDLRKRRDGATRAGLPPESEDIKAIAESAKELYCQKLLGGGNVSETILAEVMRRHGISQHQDECPSPDILRGVQRASTLHSVDGASC
ncbi:hypothetical protein DBV05_g10112 [Lasiodiplodia theobromae]|uniref:Uncharacterized protein n=1 Tax=Lasiodiplodia theobromae TaxID=45133 RepID=A0A5N5D0W5_9PEZI|nr:hypothetical protein DBV05_g10112 [Lasiodiplodia theobromae]